MDTKPASRIAGLDLLRAAAILMVLFAHYPKGEGSHGMVTRVLNFGWTGVDLFFVLSGYLIGVQLFKPIAASGKPQLGIFYLKRFGRTLPAYFVILAIYFALDPAPSPVWRFLTLTQNFGSPNTFTPSWSLCVEEQFYLLFPWFALFARRMVVYAVPLVLLAGLALRSAIWMSVRPDLLPEPAALNAYMSYLYYPTWCRLDGIALGAGLAALQCYRPAIWQALMQRGNQLLAWSGIFLLASVAMLWKHYSFWCCTVAFTFLNVSFALLAASALSPNGWISRRRIPGVEFIAALSYSLYLTHTLALDAAFHIGGLLQWPSQSPAAVVLAAVLILLSALALYHAIEAPALRYRDRLLEGRKRTRLTRLVAQPAERGS